MKSAFAVMALLLLGRPSVSAAQKPTPARLKLNAFMDARFYSGGTRVLAVSYKGIIDIYDGRNGRRLGHFVPDQSLEPYATCAVMARGGRTAIIGTGGTVKAMALARLPHFELENRYRVFSLSLRGTACSFVLCVARCGKAM